METMTERKWSCNALTVPPTVGSGVWRKLIKLPEIPPSIKIKKNVKEP